MSESQDQESIIASARELFSRWKTVDVCVCVCLGRSFHCESVCLYVVALMVFFFCAPAFYVFVQHRVLMGAFLLRAVADKWNVYFAAHFLFG